VGQLYMYGATSLHVVNAGGEWNYGVNAGSRCVFVINYPWIVLPYNGCRFACYCL